jgi:formamidopyrimidine-DNA glycosylase
MPELPDLVIFKRNLEKLLLGRRLDRVSMYRANWVSGSPEDWMARLPGGTLDEILRNGKELFFRFSNGHTISVHLMLRGRFDLVAQDNAVKDRSACFYFKDAGLLVLSDPKGWLRLSFNPPLPEPPDALSPELNLDYLRACLTISKNSTIKEFLTDQTVVRGIGNAYVDEILWDCSISPFSSPSKIPGALVDKLLASTRGILLGAIDSLEKLTPDAINGEHRSFLKIHVPEKEFAPTGELIRVEKLSGRLTYYTDRQVLYS